VWELTNHTHEFNTQILTLNLNMTPSTTQHAAVGLGHLHRNTSDV
jgi:hypothetical protein